jgi:hypothetical protein
MWARDWNISVGGANHRVQVAYWDPSFTLQNPKHIVKVDGVNASTQKIGGFRRWDHVHRFTLDDGSRRAYEFEIELEYAAQRYFRGYLIRANGIVVYQEWV